VICNWNNKAEKVVDELFKSQYDTKQDVQVAILAENRNQKIEELEKKYEGFTMISGDPALHERLAEVNVHNAKSVIILAKDESQDPDAQTALIALAINQVCRSKAVDEYVEKNRLGGGYLDRLEIEKKLEIKYPHIIADVLNHRKTRHLSDANVGEIVCSTDYGIGLLAQSAIHPGLVRVYDDLLRYTPEGNEFYLLEGTALPFDIKDYDFKDLTVWFEENFRGTDNPMILLGLMRNGEPILNPRKPAEKLQPGDKLIILAYCSPRLTDFSKCAKCP
jgi:hypothetical protein